MQWPSDEPRSTWESRRQAWERLGVLVTSLEVPTKHLGAPMTSLGARVITVEQSGKNIIIFGNAAGTSGNDSYYLSFNDF